MRLETPAIVLVQPRIPQNVGAIGRLCAANRASLHVVRPIPFDISDKNLQRAGMDYLELLDLRVHDSWDVCRQELAPRRLWYLSSSGEAEIYDIDYKPDDALVFGSEPAGLHKLLGSALPQESCLRIPMAEPRARCLNVATSVAVALYEVLRQARYRPS